MSKPPETLQEINYTNSPFSHGDRSIALKDFDPQRDVRVVSNDTNVDSYFFSTDNIKDTYHLQDKLPPLIWNTYSDDDLGNISRLIRMYERAINNSDETRVSHKWHEVAAIAVAGALIGAIPGASLHYASHIKEMPDWFRHIAEVGTAAGILVGMHVADKMSEPDYAQESSSEITELLRQARDQANKLQEIGDISQLTNLYEQSINHINETRTSHTWYEVAGIAVAGALIGAIPGAALHFANRFTSSDTQWIKQAADVTTAAGILVGMHVADKLLEPEHVKKTSPEIAELLREARDLARKSYAETVYREKQSQEETIVPAVIPESATVTQLEERLNELQEQAKPRNKLENIPTATSHATPENKVTSLTKQAVQPMIATTPDIKHAMSM